MIQNAGFDDFFGLPNALRSLYQNTGKLNFIEYQSTDGFMAPGYISPKGIVPPSVAYKSGNSSVNTTTLVAAIAITAILVMLAYELYSLWKINQSIKDLKSFDKV